MQYGGQISDLHLCKLSINLLTYLHVGKSSKGAEDETWLCVELELGLNDGHDER